MMRWRWSMAGKLSLVVGLAILLALAVQWLIVRWTQTFAIATALAAVISLIAAFWGINALLKNWHRSIDAVTHGIGSLKDGDLSVSITAGRDDQIAPLVEAYNGLGDSLRHQRQDLHSRELLLDTVIQATPLALVLTNAREQIVFSNYAARAMLNSGRLLEGLSLPQLLTDLPASLREAIAAQSDGLVTVETTGESEIFHITQRQFNLHAQQHRLLLLKPLTRELAAQEVAIWKKVIRVIAHELNNSLAPISSLAHSGGLLALEPNQEALTRVFATIEERARHLASFIDGYARFAKLPQPRLARHAWRELLEPVCGGVALNIASSQEVAWCDSAQLQQVIINLLKNARESGSLPNDIAIEVTRQDREQRIVISDHGAGFSSEALQNGLLPFFSTKDSGTGLGLTLCREIVEAHGGRLAIANRTGGGATVTIWLPVPTQDYP
jgi:two-component system, NtrC family, nitrogen regulation sensor histidine kinase NtrY